MSRLRLWLEITLRPSLSEFINEPDGKAQPFRTSGGIAGRNMVPHFRAGTASTLTQPPIVTNGNSHGRNETNDTHDPNGGNDLRYFTHGVARVSLIFL